MNMCEFCKDYNRHIRYGVPYRTQYADDNLCEKIMDDICDDCYGCMDENLHFSLAKWRNMIWLGFHHEIGDTIISKTSEGLFINYCPWCGEKLNDEFEPFDQCCVDRLVEVER